MKLESTNNPDLFSFKHIFWRTMALLFLFIILFINYRQSLLDNTSLAMMKTHLKGEHATNFYLIKDILFFCGVFLAVHVLWALTITISCLGVFNYIKEENIKTQTWLLIFLTHMLLILGANGYFVPISLLGFFRGSMLSEPALLITLSGILSALFILGLYVKLGSVTTALACTAATALITGSSYITPVKTQEKQIQPNIIIIGIDGLRPDHLAYRGATHNQTPHLDKLLSQSVIYDQTYTPMARTYIAWLSLLKGQYPMTHGGRFNLAPPELIDRNIPLVENLKSRGYQTTYAMDERRFNQIDEAYGFDNAIGPKIGAADAVVSSIADFPIINLIVKTRVAKYLFPYLYLNRANGKTYDPLMFNDEVISALSTDKPNFLAVHFCMLHWPWTTKDFIPTPIESWQGNYNHFMYQAMFKKLDDQIGDLLNRLKAHGELSNAIVYIISDHGEGFMLDRDMLESLSTEKASSISINAWGHGTNIINQSQANVLMAYSRFSDAKVVSAPAKMNGIFSLVDIAPTLFQQLDFTHRPQSPQFDGIVLPTQHQHIDDNRMTFVESAKPIRSINQSFIDKNQVMSETAATYEIRGDGRLVIKPDKYREAIAKKQRSVYFKSWQLVMLPEQEELVLINTQKKQWSFLNPSLEQAPWQAMLSKLCSHYQGDRGFDLANNCQLVAQDN